MRFHKELADQLDGVKRLDTDLRDTHPNEPKVVALITDCRLPQKRDNMRQRYAALVEQATAAAVGLEDQASRLT